MARTPRLVDVAQAAGVSIATASRALAGTSGVSPSVADKVRETALGLGYVANQHARSLASGSTDGVGLLVHEIGDPYFSEIASGVLQVATEQRRTVQISHTGRDPQSELDEVRRLTVNRIGSILIAGSGFVDSDLEQAMRDELDRFVSSGGRVAVIGRHGYGVDSVLPDNIVGGSGIAEHVLSLGHRRITVMAGSLGLTTVADRLEGVRQGVADAGHDPAAVPVVEGVFTREGGREATGRLLAEHPETTAIMALNDDMAIGCLSELRSRGIAVPEQVSVTGFDDVAVAGDLSPGLTTVALPMADMGARALRMALKEPAARPRRQRVPATLVVRDSTGPVRRERKLS